MKTLLLGIIAGSAGKAALDLASYLDMIVQDRTSSDVPAKVAQAMGDSARDALTASPIDADGAEAVSSEPSGSGSPDDEDDRPGPRATAAGALSGFAIGLGLGAVYALVRQNLDDRPIVVLVGGLGLTAAAMAASDIPAVATGATTDPRGWTRSAWLSDIISHAAYGFATAFALEVVRKPRAVGTFPGAVSSILRQTHG